jgi:hypothetical protein
MALTSVNAIRGDLGAAGYISIDDITFDASYPAGGYAVPASIPIYTILAMTEVGGATASGPYEFFWNRTTSKLQVFVSPAINPTVTIIGGQSTATSVPLVVSTAGTAGILGATGAIGTITIAGSVFGISQTQGGLAEVTAATNLSTVVARMMTIGF